MRITMVLPKSVSATRDGGIRPCRWVINDHTCSRVFARARAIPRRWVSPISDNARHSVGSEATGPNNCAWSRSMAKSDSTRPPSAISTAVSASTRPRS
jgi:hypothetical protein